MPEPCPPASFHLVPHPASPDTVIDAITCTLAIRNDQLVACFIFTGKVAQLRLPSPAPPRAADGLWQHTCCELFLARRDDPFYLEFNFSPSSAWTRYAFRSPRQRIESRLPDGATPRIVHTLSNDGMVLEARIPAELLSPLELTRNALDIALCCVTESAHGHLGWWALHHPASRPDFHLRESFVPLPAPFFTTRS